MSILLDMHVYLWWLSEAPLLSPSVREFIATSEPVYVSAASIWECVIKVEVGKLEANPSELVAGISRSGFEPLFITSEHVLALQQLPKYHKDPFDRILIAQAVSESVQLVTADKKLLAYSELVIKV